MKTFIWKGSKATAMKGHNDDLIMSLAIGCWLAESNTETYNLAQIEYADALLKGMEVNKVTVKDTNISPFYNSKETVVNPFIPVPTSESNYTKNSKNNPFGNLTWLIK